MVAAAAAPAVSEPKITAAVVEALAERRQEPDWLRRRRLEAWEAFEKLPLQLPADSPTVKHYTKLTQLKMEGFTPIGLNGRGSKAVVPAMPVLEEFEALAVLEGTQTKRAFLSEGLRSQGVIFTDLVTAAQRHPQLVEKYLLSRTLHGVPPDEQKPAAFHSALWTGGMFLYVPAHVQIPEPVQVIHKAQAPGCALSTHTLIIAEPGSMVTYVDGYASPPGTPEALHTEIQEAHVGEGAAVHFYSLQNWSQSAVDFSYRKAVVHKDAHMSWVVGNLGSHLTVSRVENVLAGPGASGQNLGLFLGHGEQHEDISANAAHLAPHTQNTILTKGVVTDAATSVYRGHIFIDQPAGDTDSQLSGATLLLSEHAHANAVPSLEIKTNNVKAKHAAYVTNLDQDQIFYVMSRGIERPQAERIVVDGFFEPVLSKIRGPAVRALFHRPVEERMRHGGY